jgi:hypothetical protein
VLFELRFALVRKLVIVLELAVSVSRLRADSRGKILLGNAATLALTSTILWGNVLNGCSLSEVMCMERTYDEIGGGVGDKPGVCVKRKRLSEAILVGIGLS